MKNSSMKQITSIYGRLPKWLSALGLTATVISVYLLGYLASLQSQSTQPYMRVGVNDDRERVLHNVGCSGLMAQGQPDFVFASVRHFFTEEKIDFSAKVITSDFLVPASESYIDELSEREMWNPHWVVTPLRSGSYSIPVEVNSSHKPISDSMACTTTVINTFGLKLDQVFNGLSGIAIVGTYLAGSLVRGIWQRKR